jgi:hypothetical protein
MNRMVMAAAFACAATGAMAQDTGIPVCDDFYKQYEACITTKMPEAQRATFKAQLDAARAQIRSAAANPAARAQLEQSCQMQKEQIGAALKPMGCEFK